MTLRWVVTIGLLFFLAFVAQMQWKPTVQGPGTLVVNSRGPLATEETATGIYEATKHMVGLGVAAYNFVLAGAYRTGPQSFALVGLASKALHTFGQPTLGCSWHGTNQTQPLVGSTRALLTDWNFGRVYSSYVVHCSFPDAKATQNGGRLHFSAGTGYVDGDTAEVVALEEKPGDFKESSFPGGQGFEYKYDYLYCGSSLFGDINPDLLSQWLAYHAMLFGPRSHFVFHDTGGLQSEANQRVVEPWVKAGLVTVYNFTEQEKFDGYYHNQFLVIDDCFFRYKYAANWTFFFDVDEYVYIRPPKTLKSTLDELGQSFTQILFLQNLMSHSMCAADDKDHSSDWGFEKLVFRRVKGPDKLNRKYVIKAALADSAGVHLSEHIQGKTGYTDTLSYYHFHNTIIRRDICTEFVKPPENRLKWIKRGDSSYVYDDSLALLAEAAKAYQRKIIGRDSSAQLPPTQVDQNQSLST